MIRAPFNLIVFEVWHQRSVSGLRSLKTVMKPIWKGVWNKIDVEVVAFLYIKYKMLTRFPKGNIYNMCTIYTAGVTYVWINILWFTLGTTVCSLVHQPCLVSGADVEDTWGGACFLDRRNLYFIWPFVRSRALKLTSTNRMGEGRTKRQRINIPLVGLICWNFAIANRHALSTARKNDTLMGYLI